MPLTIITGAQFGSEGKGKIAYWWAKRKNSTVAVRVGGPNSGHTVVTDRSDRTVLQQLPTPSLIPGTTSILPPGSYLDLQVLMHEISLIGSNAEKIVIDPDATIITARERAEEAAADLVDRIGSTGSGTGAAVARRVMRDGSLVRAANVPDLRPFLGDTLGVIRGALADGERVVLEGTQGYGLSLLHGGHGDYATSRDTTAAGALAEAGVSPLDVDEIVLVARAFPIRVAGNSGPLPLEIDWATVAEQSGQGGIQELTTVTKKLRRVARFDPSIVRRALAANRPTHLVLNHVDYISDLSDPKGMEAASRFIAEVENAIGRNVDLVGLGPSRVIDRGSMTSFLGSGLGEELGELTGLLAL